MAGGLKDVRLMLSTAAEAGTKLDVGELVERNLSIKLMPAWASGIEFDPRTCAKKAGRLIDRVFSNSPVIS